MHDINNRWIWSVFIVFIVFALTLDTLITEKKHAAGPHRSMWAALCWTLVWVGSALTFNALLWLYLYFTDHAIANQKALDFFAGYLIEKSLSIDNLFTFYVIFHQLRIPHAYQPRVFTYGIWSAIGLRLLLILLGVWAINQFHWLLYLLGIFLLLTGIKMIFFREEKKSLQQGAIYQWLKRTFRITDELQGQRFFIRQKTKIYITRLLVALIFIEISDLIFAFDSIPAIFAITRDPFIIWTSNIFAILGLRTLYFLLSGMIQKFYLLKYGIALILIFVGAKMTFESWISISTLSSIIIIIAILVSFTMLSIYSDKRARS